MKKWRNRRMSGGSRAGAASGGADDRLRANSAAAVSEEEDTDTAGRRSSISASARAPAPAAAPRRRSTPAISSSRAPSSTSSSSSSPQKTSRSRQQQKPQQPQQEQPAAAATTQQPDLSNLWSRQRASVPGEEEEQGATRKTSSSATRQASIRYPVIAEDDDALLHVPRDLLLSNNSRKNHSTPAVAATTANGSKDPRAPQPTAKAAVKPGAVAVQGAGPAAAQQQKDFSMSENEKKEAEKMAAANNPQKAKPKDPPAAAVGGGGDGVGGAPLWGHRPTGRSSSLLGRPASAQKSSLLSDDDEDEDDEGHDHTNNDKANNAVARTSIQKQPLVAAAVSTSVSSVCGNKPKQSSLLDDDDDEKDDAISHSAVAAFMGQHASSSAAMKQKQPSTATAGVASMPTTTTTAATTAAVTTGSPPIWGRKAKKLTLEDDTPDGRELAFAEGTSALPPPSFTFPAAAATATTTTTTTPLLGEPAAAAGTAAAAASKTAATATGTAITGASVDSGSLDEVPDPRTAKKHSEMTEEELLEAVLAESKKTALEDSNRQLLDHHSRNNNTAGGTEADGGITILSAQDVEEAKENSRSLRSLITSDDVDVGFLQTVLDMCRADQRRVAKGIEDAMLDESGGADGEQEVDLEALIDLNVNILDAIESGGKVVEDNRKPAPTNTNDDDTKPQSKKKNKQDRKNLDVEDLVEKRDIFSLICMLRVHQNEKRLDAAMALMRFARAAERNEDKESILLRDEIRSSGGLHSLLTLFWTRGISYELRVVTALAVAFVLPSFVEPSSLSSPSVGLKIVECLRFLSTAQSVSHGGEFLSAEDDLFAASAMALTTFWVNHLEPFLRSKKSVSVDANPGGLTLKRQRSQWSAGSAVFDQRRDSITGDELLEMTISLIIHVAKHETSDLAPNQDEEATFRWSHHLIEQVCAVEGARAIAVQKGILQILVTWIRSSDRERIRSAVSALRYLTSVNDKYMAGWIHSEMVNKGAVKGLAELTQDLSTTHDVRLAIAQILSSLCSAPQTRAAVVETNCFNFLIGVLYEHSSPSTEELALFAGSAVLQLSAGAIARASAFSNDDLTILGISTHSRRDSLIGDVVESGAISSFVSIAKTTKNKRLRSIAVQALRIISEDVNAARQTRLRLCEDGVAMALGVTLKEDIAVLGSTLRSESDVPADLEHSLWDLHEALCALANILDPEQEGTPLTSHVRDISSSSFKDPQHLLIKGCLETANSGGLESLLHIANLPFQLGSDGSRNLELIEEACRSLSSMASLLLTAKVAAAGYSKFAYDVLLALQNVLDHISLEEGEATDSTAGVGLHSIVLQGVSALARSEPLKIRIIHRSLPHLLRAKNSRAQGDIAMVAGQALQSLNLAEDEVAAQVAGNAPSVLAEWFCLERSLLIQAMAREEIRRFVRETWESPFQDTPHGLSKLMHDSSVASLARNDEQGGADSALFENFADDSDTISARDSLLCQYKDMYEERYADGSLPLNGSWEDTEIGLLAQQTYPLSSRSTKTKWILEHRRSIMTPELAHETSGNRLLSEHVEHLLEVCFPSVMLRDEIVPVHTLRPDASFNFRALMMAQRRYFSFRREGQLLSCLCDKEVESLGTEDIHWTLGFTNSSFSGEFAEVLVQVLYKCPMICDLSFVRNSDWKEDEQSAKGGDGSGLLLANLVGSLPAWISHLTFEGFFSEADLRTLVSVLETMGKLATGNDGSIESHAKFHFFAVRRSPDIPAGAWLAFFNLIGGKFRVSGGPTAHPLASLKALDLGGNKLGDDLCASILEVLYDRSSGCKLEELDLSGNMIGAATSVLRVLRTYCNKQLAGSGAAYGKWTSPLCSLRLASNGLQANKAWLEILILLQNDGLGLQLLDLSANEIADDSSEYEVADIVLQTLMSNGSLNRLNLSKNRFSSGVVDRIIVQLAKKDFGYAIIQLEENSPRLSPAQTAAMNEISNKTRKRVLQRHLTISKSPQDRLGRMSIDENTAIERFDAKFPSYSSGKRLGDNSITVLFSAPLVFTDGHTLRPFAKLDFDMERELMWQCLKEASRDISLSFDSATHDRLLACMTKRCSCLHYSGHGHQQYLPFEDGSGGPYWFKVDQFKSLIEREGGAPFRFVFVSACYSYLAGETFASAGVPHVVCCQQESELKDTAALAFTTQFYLALAIGHTVKASFEQGCKAVRATPNLKDPDAEMKKFLLLPKDGDHNVPIFDAEPVSEWPRNLGGEETGHRGRRLSSRSVARSVLGGAKSSELSVRNMMQEDPSPSPPEFFLGREVDMYYVLKAVLGKRLVSVIGETGVGRSSLACALCHYINERATTIIGIDRIYYVKARQSRKRNPFRALVQRLLKKLVEERKGPSVDPEAEMETMCDAVCRYLKHDKALVVFDRAELVVNDEDDANEFPLLLRKLSRETKNIKVLLTNRHSLGIPSLGEHPISLGPLNFADTVRLFANLCPYLHTPKDRRKMYESLVRDGEKAELLATDPGIGDSAKEIFSILGDGIPSRIEKAAYDLTKENFLQLYKATTTDE